MNNTDLLKSAFMRLVGLGLSLCYFRARDGIEVPTEMMNVMEEPFKTTIQTTLLMCAYAGTGDVLIIQELLRIVGEKVEVPKKDKKDKGERLKERKERRGSFTKIKGPRKAEWDYSSGQSMAILAVAVVAMGEDIGKLILFLDRKILNFRMWKNNIFFLSYAFSGFPPLRIQVPQGGLGSSLLIFLLHLLFLLLPL